MPAFCVNVRSVQLDKNIPRSLYKKSIQSRRPPVVKCRPLLPATALDPAVNRPHNLRMKGGDKRCIWQHRDWPHWVFDSK